MSETAYEAITLSAFLLLMVAMVGENKESGLGLARQSTRTGLIPKKRGSGFGSASGGDNDQFGISMQTLDKNDSRARETAGGGGGGAGYGHEETYAVDEFDQEEVEFESNWSKLDKKEREEREKRRDEIIVQVMKTKEKRKMPFPVSAW